MIHQAWRLSEAGDDNLGLACTEQGLVLGRTPLIERRNGRFVARQRNELNHLLKRAYPDELSLDRLMAGLATVASALNANDPGLARIAAVHLRIPDLPDEAARDAMEAADILIKAGDWNAALHPRTGVPPNPGWFAATDSSGDGPAGSDQSESRVDLPGTIRVTANQSENKQVRDIVVRLGLNRSQQQQLHREISGMGYNYHEILEIAKDIFGK